MLLSVGMALTRLAMVWRGRARHPHLSAPAEAESSSDQIPRRYDLAAQSDPEQADR
jgi:hypothetical protein